MKCARCEAVFRVRPPAEAPEPVAITPAPAPWEEAPPTQRSSAPVQREPDRVPEPLDRERLVLVAIPDEELAKQTASALAERGLQTRVVHDGVEAMLEVQRQLPRTVVLSAALPKMYGFQICEVMKRNESLRSIPVILAGSIHDTDRYRREPSELYGADAYLEDPDLPGGLIPILEKIGLPMSPAETPPAEPAPPTAAPAGPEEPASQLAPSPVAPPQPAPTSVTPSEPPAADDGLAAERTEAARLARIIVSDIVLYNEDKFAKAIQQNTVVEAMVPELQEGKSLFRQRVDERVRGEKDYLVEELLRVARLRASG